LYLACKGLTGVYATWAFRLCQSRETLALGRIGCYPSVQAQDEGEIPPERMARFILLFRRETGKESLKCGLICLHSGRIQAA
jgi:hypothetical protein